MTFATLTAVFFVSYLCCLRIRNRFPWQPIRIALFPRSTRVCKVYVLRLSTSICGHWASGCEVPVCARLHEWWRNCNSHDEPPTSREPAASLTRIRRHDGGVTWVKPKSAGKNCARRRCENRIKRNSWQRLKNCLRNWRRKKQERQKRRRWMASARGCREMCFRLTKSLN